MAARITSSTDCFIWARFSLTDSIPRSASLSASPVFASTDWARSLTDSEVVQSSVVAAVTSEARCSSAWLDSEISPEISAICREDCSICRPEFWMLQRMGVRLAAICRKELARPPISSEER